jgi:hypothetical protein
LTILIRKTILRANALYLLIASVGGFLADVLGIFFLVGVQSRVMMNAPHAGIGFVEAHGLAFIIGILLWRAAPSMTWHLTATAVHVLLGTANLVFWQIFVAADVLVAGYVTTSLHWLFVVLQLAAAYAARAEVAPKLALAPSRDALV